MSYQYHEHRKEFWTVVKGTLSIVLDDLKTFRKAGQSIRIPLGAKHRAWNETDEEVIFIEVQNKLIKIVIIKHFYKLILQCR